MSHLDDQWAAATRDADIARDRFASSGRNGRGEAELSPQLKARLIDIVQRFTRGEMTVCRHLTRGPAPTFIGFWDDRQARCMACTHNTMPEGEEQWRCDLCGQIRPGALSLQMVPVEALTIGFGVCDSCRSREGLPV